MINHREYYSSEGIKIDTQFLNRDTRESHVYIALIDLECTCDSDQNFSPNEIIEIGAVIGTLSQESFHVVDELQIYVRPVINPTLTNFCIELTGISQSTVDGAVILEEALPLLESWLQKNNVAAWTSWGKFDSNQFARECELKSLNNPMATFQHLNIKQLFARKFGPRVGLARAQYFRKLKFFGRLHSGIEDARNIAALLAQEFPLRDAILKRISAHFNFDSIQSIDVELFNRIVSHRLPVMSKLPWTHRCQTTMNKHKYR